MAEEVIVDPGPISIAASLLLSALGILLAIEARAEYEATTDLLEELNQCRLDMACELQEHNLGVIYPFIRCVMDEICEYEEPQPDYGGMCSFFQGFMSGTNDLAHQAHSTYVENFCFCPSDCQTQTGYYAALAGVDSAYARTRFQERREEKMRELKFRALQQAHAGTFRSPSAIFQLLDVAGSIYGYIQGQAFSNYAGALSVFGYGITTALSGIFN